MIEITYETMKQCKFPTWEDGKFDGPPTGVMRASGMVANDNRLFIFENVENTVAEGGIIQNVAHIVGIPDIDVWVRIGNGLYLEVNNENGEFDVKFGDLQITVRGEPFTLTLGRDDLIRTGYLPSEATELTVEALLFKVVDSTPKDLLFSTLDGLKELFGLPEETQRLFVIETWRHPTTDDIYGEGELSVTDFPDLLEMVDALCEGRTTLNLPDEPTTDWRLQVAKQSRPPHR